MKNPFLREETESARSPTLKEVQNATSKTVNAVLRSNEKNLVKAPPGAGKTTSVIKEAAELGLPITYLTARHDLYDQAIQMCDSENLSYKELPVFTEDCPTYSGGHGEDWSSRFGTLYGRGVSGKSLHHHLNPPCMPNCSYVDGWDFDSAEQDVLIGHYVQAHVPSVVENRIVIFDEFPEDAFINTFEHPQADVSAFLRSHYSVPFDNWSDLIVNRDDIEKRNKAFKWFASNGGDQPFADVSCGEIPDEDVIHNPNIKSHTDAGKLVIALLSMEDLGKHFESTTRMVNNPYGDDESVPLSNLEPKRRAVFGDTRVVRDRENDEMYFLTPPNLTDTRAVVALDGTPTLSMWETVLGTSLMTRSVLPESLMDRYLKDTMGYQIKQPVYNGKSGGIKPYSSGNYITEEKDEALFLGVEIKYGKKSALIAPKKAIQKYNERGVLCRVNDTMNYANVGSSNDFSSKSLGIVSGSPHPGDQIIKRWGALMGVEITSNGERGINRSYGELGDEILTHFREHQVLQAILRFGREEDVSPTVIVNTLATPDWLEPDQRVNPSLFRGEKTREITDYLRNADSPQTVAEIENDVSAKEQRVRDVLNSLSDDGLVQESLRVGTTASTYSWAT